MRDILASVYGMEASGRAQTREGSLNWVEMEMEGWSYTCIQDGQNIFAQALITVRS